MEQDRNKLLVTFLFKLNWLIKLPLTIQLITKIKIQRDIKFDRDIRPNIVNAMMSNGRIGVGFEIFKPA